MIGDSNKHVGPSIDPKGETHIIDRIRKLLVRNLFNQAVIKVIGQDLVMNVQENLHVELSLKSFSILNMISSKAIVTGVTCNSAQVDRNIWKNCTPDDRNIQNPSRVDTLGVNVDLFSPTRGSNYILTKYSRNIEPLDTSIHGYETQERNLDFSCIEKMGVKHLPEQIVPDLDPSIQVNLANSIISESPKFKNLGLLTFDATGKPNIDFSPSTRAKSLNGTRRENLRAYWMGWGIHMILKE